MPIKRSSRGLRSSTIVAVTVTVFMLAAMLYTPAPAEAASHGKTVRGWVWDQVGRNVTGADVVVRVLDGETLVSENSASTDDDGFYSVILLSTEWDIGNTIRIIVTYDSSEDNNQTDADDSMVQYVNMTYKFEIPEFGSLAGMAIAAFALGGVAVAAMVLWRRK